MYRIEDKEAAVKQVQRLLDITVTGVFDEETRLAVISFQNRKGLNESGIVDYESFTLMKEEYLKEDMRREARRRLPFSPRFPYSFGDMGNDVTLINALLNDVMKEYTVEVLSVVGVFYSDRTENAVRELRKIFGLREGGHIDEEFFYRLTEEQKSLQNKNSRKKQP